MLSLVLVASAFAGAPTTPAPEVRREVNKLYPRPKYDDWSRDLACTVDVTLGEKGKPAEVVGVDCEEPLLAWTLKRVRRDRWDKAAVPGTVVRRTVTYEAPANAVEIEDAQYYRRRQGTTCAFRVDVGPDGATTLVADEGACAPALASFDATDARLLDPKTPSECTVTFVLVDGAPRHLDLFRCGVHTWDQIRAGLPRWSWPVLERPAPYSVQLRWQIERGE